MGAPALTPRHSIEALEEGVAILRAINCAAREAGRDPGEIRRIYNMSGPFTASAPARARDTDQAIAGPPEHWVEVLTHLALDVGFDTFLLFAPPDPDAPRTFIEDVAPQVRDRVESARARELPQVG
jgi:alkanesulfonate monooxygenase SsuD/methylene tetrahydromethanopterin reductase-like flavin-dependent oxidoreductase (luciferase family)